MRSRSPNLIAGLLLCGACFAADLRPDTAALLTHLGQFRGQVGYELTGEEYKVVQGEYSAWVDARVRSGASVDRMNDELRAAGLFPGSLIDDEAPAGYLEEIRVESGKGSSDLRALVFGVDIGNCSVDETAALYPANPVQRLAWLNAEQSHTHGYILGEPSTWAGQTPPVAVSLVRNGRIRAALAIGTGTSFGLTLSTMEGLRKFLSGCRRD